MPIKSEKSMHLYVIFLKSVRLFLYFFYVIKDKRAGRSIEGKRSTPPMDTSDNRRVRST